jgi:hypothetical protein
VIRRGAQALADTLADRARPAENQHDNKRGDQRIFGCNRAGPVSW